MVGVHQNVRPKVSSFLPEVVVIETVLGLIYYVLNGVAEGYSDVVLHKVDKSWEDLLYVVAEPFRHQERLSLKDLVQQLELEKLHLLGRTMPEHLV